MELDPSAAKPHVYYAAMLVEESKFEEAKKHYDIVLEVEPNAWKVYWVYSLICEKRLKKINLAKKWYKKAVRLNPSLSNKSFKEYFKPMEESQNNTDEENY